MLDDIKKRKMQYKKEIDEKQQPQVEWIGAAKEVAKPEEENPFSKPSAKKFIPADSQKEFKKPANEKKDMAEYDAYIKELYKVIDKIENQSPKIPKDNFLENHKDEVPQE